MMNARYWVVLLAGLMLGCNRGDGTTHTTVEKAPMARPQSFTPLSEPVEIPAPAPTATENGSPSVTVVPDDALCNLSAPLPDGIDGDMSVEALHGKGKEFILNKDGQNAVVVLKTALEKAPDNTLVRSDYGLALLQCKMTGLAVEEYEEAVAQMPEHVDIVFNLAQAYQIAGRKNAAVAAYTRAAELAPEDAGVKNNLAVALLSVGEVKAAEKQVREAILLEPENVDFMIDLAHVLARQKRFSDAEIVIGRAIKREPNNADVYNTQGYIFYLEERLEDASASFKKALEYDPEHIGALENLKAVNKKFEFDAE